jgi:hypothetical protein
MCDGITNPLQQNQYVKLGTHNFAIVKDYTYFGIILKNKKSLKTRDFKKNYEWNWAYYALLHPQNSQSVLIVKKIKNLQDIKKTSGNIQSRNLDNE